MDACSLPADQVEVVISPSQKFGTGYTNGWAGGLGKNLFDPMMYADRTSSGVTATVNDNEYITLSGTFTNQTFWPLNTWKIMLRPGFYRLSCVESNQKTDVAVNLQAVHNQSGPDMSTSRFARCTHGTPSAVFEVRAEG